MILTTHTMAEAESLCNKIGILVNGRFACIGETEFLKRNVGGCYTITIHLDQQELLSNGLGAGLAQLKNEREKEICERIEESLGPLERVPQNDLTCQFKIPVSQIKFSQFFAVCEKLFNEKKMKDYSITLSSLEDLFVQYCKVQKDLNHEEGAGRQPHWERVRI